jgi:hypothetical protein
MSAEQALESLKKYGKQVYEWLKANKATTKAILTSKALNEDLGTDVPRKIKGYMEMVGLAKGSGVKKVKKTTAFGSYDAPEYEAPRMVGSAKPKRAPSAYALFVKEFARKSPGPDLMKRAAAAYRSR